MALYKTLTQSLGFVILATYAASPAFAQPSDPMAGVYACRAVENDAERLACFDKAVTELQQRQQAGEVQAIDTAAIEQLERDSFGLSLPSLGALLQRSGDGQRGEVTEVTEKVRSARISNVSQRAIVTLENGQVWEQIDTTRVNASTLRRASEARIRRAALGSFLMNIDGSPAFRVKRVS
ncbi:hypothetical protein [Hyphomonas sp.]|uniref:hypothetical protein n=1 Tax=Hyphomonas sp. TaxID=87 RepID=UPI003918742F